MESMNEMRKLIMDDLQSVQSVMLSQQQWDVLQVIRAQGEVRASEIANLFRFKSSHTSMVISALFTKGYIDRTRRGSIGGGWEYVCTLNASLVEGELPWVNEKKCASTSIRNNPTQSQAITTPTSRGDE